MLSRLGLDYSERGGELVFRCQSGRHEDRVPSCRVRDGGGRNGLFHCFSCKWSGDVYTLVEKVLDLDFTEAYKFVRGSIGKVRPERDADAEDDYPDPVLYEPEPIDPPKGLRDVDGRCRDYLLRKRGLDAAMIEGYGVRDWRWRRRAWVPLTRDGKLISWLARAYDGSKPKVLTPAAGHGSHEWALFGLDVVDRSVGRLHFTEGWIDAIRVRQAGFENVVAACGSVVTEEQVDEIAWAGNVVHWQDADVAGRAMTRDLRAWLGRRCEVEVVVLPAGTDPADHSARKLRKFYNHRR